VSRHILLLDLDQFLVGVELLRRPELRGRPVIVGGDGDPSRRGVVATASYEARRHGVGSGMPLRFARRRCPDAVFLPLDRQAYAVASEQVMRTLAEFPGVLEIAGWDEAFLQTDTDDPESLARRIQQRVAERTGLSCSIGIGENKLQAKTASDFGKPGGVFRLDAIRWPQVMDGQGVRKLWGIGPQRAQLLAELGIRTVGQLARADETLLAEAFGPTIGPALRQAARGIDDSAVRSQAPAPKSRGREVTFQSDLVEPAEIRERLLRLAGEVAMEVLPAGSTARRVVVKVRFAPFTTHEHRAPVDPARAPREAIAAAALQALAGFDLDRPVRLLGVRVDLAPDGSAGGERVERSQAAQQEPRVPERDAPDRLGFGGEPGGEPAQ
jgi:DNA polymerase-4